VKKYAKALILTLICLAVFIPFASNDPDGLEKVAETLGVQEHTPTWTGLMPDYTFPTIGDSNVSTFFSGIFGVLLILAATFVLGMMITKPEKK
jgi:cobalt/nickel transport protein